MPPGEVCTPDILVDPCVDYTTAFSLSCPSDNVDLSYVPDTDGPFPTTRCRVCGVGRVEKDEDEREGYFLADIYFGQNSVETIINEDPIAEYRVYVVDDIRRRLLPQPVAIVPKRPEEETSCCRVDAYRAHISTMLPAGSDRFMVVPVTLYGHELPVGVTSDVIEDTVAEGPYFLRTVPTTNFSFIIRTAVDVQFGDGTLVLSSQMGPEEQMPCRQLRLLREGVVVVPVRPPRELLPNAEYEVQVKGECFMFQNGTVYPISPVNGLRLRTEDPENATADVYGPRLLDATSTHPLSGALTLMSEFRFLFDEVVLRGPGPLALVRLADSERGPATVVDLAPALIPSAYLPGLVTVRPGVDLEKGASYEVVFGPGALQDVHGNMAHSSKEYEAPGEWEHRVACFRGQCPDGPMFGLDNFVVRVPARGGVEEVRPPELTWVLYPAPEQTIFRHENLVLEFVSPVSPHSMATVMELCTNWTTTDVCPHKRTLEHKDMLFVGDKVIVNPLQYLVPGYQYNVSIQNGVFSNFEGLRATAAGHFQYSFSVHPQAVFDRSPPELVAVEVDCSNISSPGDATELPGCSVWHRMRRQIVGEAEKWGLADGAPPPPVPRGARFRFYFHEPVQIVGRNAATLSAEPLEKEPLTVEQVPAMVGSDVEDAVLVVAPELLPGELYTVAVGPGVADLATWPEPNRFSGAALTFFTELPPPEVTIASNEGFKEAAASTSVMLQFEGVAVLADPNSELEVELRQINPASDSPDEQHLRVADPSQVFFLGQQIMLLPRPLRAGTSYNLTVPSGVVRHFDQSFSFVFTTRPEDRVKPSIVWTWPRMPVSKLTIDRMLVHLYFSEEVQPGMSKFLLVDEMGSQRFRFDVAQDLCQEGVLFRGCVLLDLAARRLSLLPAGIDAQGRMIPWAEAGRTYQLRIEEAAFTDAVTVGELRKNSLPESGFHFSVLPDTDGPVLASSEPANNSGHVDPNLGSVLLTFNEPMKGVDSDFGVRSTVVPRPAARPTLEMIPGVVDVNPEVGFAPLIFDFDVEAGSGFFHIYIWNREVSGENVTVEAAFIKEVPVEDAFFVRNMVMLNPFPLPLAEGSNFWVAANQTAVVGSNGLLIAEDFSTFQAGVEFRIAVTELRVLFTSMQDWRCHPTKLSDIELYLNEHILDLNTSGRELAFQDPQGRELWRLPAEGQVTLDPRLPFKAMVHLGHLGQLPGGEANPLASGGVFRLVVDEGLFVDRAEIVEGNRSVLIPAAATCGGYNFSCGEGRQVIDNATWYRCADPAACTELDNQTCCEDMPSTTSTSTTEVPCDLNDTNCTNETLDLGRRLMGPLRPPRDATVLEPTFDLEVLASPMITIPIRICETQYQDLHNRTARIYVSLEVPINVRGRRMPQEFEVYLPPTAVQDMLGNFPQEAAMISFTHDLQAPELDVRACHPPNNRNATEQEIIQLSFTEEIKAGSGFFELWDVEDQSGPQFRIDVQSLAVESSEFPRRSLVAGRVVSLVPSAICEGICRDFTGVTYVLTTSEPGVLYDMMDNPLPMLDSNTTGPGGWRFEVNENVTRAPEILRANHVVMVNGSTPETVVTGYLYFSQRVYQNGSLPGTVLARPEIEVWDCGIGFDCSSMQLLNNSDTVVIVSVDPWDSTSFLLLPGLAQFRIEMPDDTPRRLKVMVPPYSFMGADTLPGSLAGPLAQYEMVIDTGNDPTVEIERPRVLDGGCFPQPGEQYVAADTMITLYFSEEVVVGAGNLLLCDASEPHEDPERCTLATFGDGSAASLDVRRLAKIRRRVVTWRLPQVLAFGQTIRIVMPEGLFLAANRPVTAAAYHGGSFSVSEGDVVPPVILAVHPTEEQHGTVTLVFSEAVMFACGICNQGTLVELVDADSQERLHFEASVDGNLVEVHGPFEPGHRYSLRSSAAALMDAAGNRALNMPLQPEIFEISDDTDGPVAELPMHRELHRYDVFYLRFDEAVMPGNSSITLESMPPEYCGIACGRRQMSSWSMPGLRHLHFEELGALRSLIQVVPEEPLLPGFHYDLVAQPNFAVDTVGNLQSEGVSHQYAVAFQRDSTPPRLVAALLGGRAAPTIFDQDSSPTGGLELFFSESLRPLEAVSAPLLLVPYDGGDRCSEMGVCMPRRNCSLPCGFIPASRTVAIPATGLEVRGSIVNMDLGQLPPLEYGRGYRLQVMTEFFQDLAGNAAVAMENSGAPALAFGVANSQAETADDPDIVAISPADGQLMVPQTTALQIIFDRPVQVGSGDFVLVPAMEQEPGTLEENVSRSDAHSYADHSMENISEGNQSAGMMGDDSTLAPVRPNFTAAADAVLIPAAGCHTLHATVTCLPPPLRRGVEYAFGYSHGALQVQGRPVSAGPLGRLPSFRVMDRSYMFLSLTALHPSGQPWMPDHEMHEEHRRPRRLRSEADLPMEHPENPEAFALSPKPSWFAAKGATLAINFSSSVQLGAGHLSIVDCSPGNASRCYDGMSELVPDEEVMGIEVSSEIATEYILLENTRALLVSRGLRPGRLHALRSRVLGIFRDEDGNPSLPLTSGLEFWVQPDDSRLPEILMQVPANMGHAATDSNITLFFNEGLQADVNGSINISDGTQEEIIDLSAPSNVPGVGFVLMQGSMIVINPALDFGLDREVMVTFEPGTFRDLAGNPFKGLSEGEYVFRSPPSAFALVAPYVRYPNFREPRFTPRAGAMLHYVNGTFLLSGGETEGFCLADTWVSQTGEDWTQVEGVTSQDFFRSIPLIAYSPTVMDKEGCIWLLGGICNDESGTLWKTCDIGRSWMHLSRPTAIPFGQEVPPSFPQTFHDHALAILGGWQLVIADVSPGSSEAIWRYVTPSAERVQRVGGGRADDPSRAAPLGFNLRHSPKLLATSAAGLFLLGGHLCAPGDRLCPDVFNDVWFSPDGGAHWHCKTKSYAAGWDMLQLLSWHGVGARFEAELTQDDTIYVLGGQLPGTEEALAFAYQSYIGLEDIYLTDSEPFMILPGSVELEEPPALPGDVFRLIFGEAVRLAMPGHHARFVELPGNYSYVPENYTKPQGGVIEAMISEQGKDLALRPVVPLLQGRRYQVEIDARVVQDLAGNAFGHLAGTKLQVDILEDQEVPYLTSMLPTSGSRGVEPWTVLALTFSEEVMAGEGSLQVIPKMAYGATLHLPVSEADIVREKALFRLPPGRRYTPDMEYRVLVPAGLLRDRLGNKVSAVTAGSFTTLNGVVTTSDYFGAGMPRNPAPADDIQEEGFPDVLATWPSQGATDVPPRPNVDVFFYFAAPVKWAPHGQVQLFNETGMVLSIPTDSYAPGRPGNLAVLAEERAVKVRIPTPGGIPLLRVGRNFSVALTPGALQDMSLGNVSDAIRVDFKCLEMSQGNAMPRAVASDITHGETEVPGSRHVFNVWYSEDIVKSTDQKPPVSLDLPGGGRAELPGASPEVEIRRNRLTATFPPHVMAAGGFFTLRVPRFLFLDVVRRTNNILEGGGNPSMEAELVITFAVRAEPLDRPNLNTTFCRPASEEDLDAPLHEFPAQGNVLLGFSEPVMAGPGNVTFAPRSFLSPIVDVPGMAAVVAGSYALLSPQGLLPGEVYNVTVAEDAFLDLDGYMLEPIDEQYVISTLPELRFRQVGTRNWDDPTSVAPGGRMAPATTVDTANRVVVVGGRSGQASPIQGRDMNDVWILTTHKEVNCASAYEGETSCSLQRCEPDETGRFNLGDQTTRRFVWRRKSTSGGDCIAASGETRSQLGEEIARKTEQCNCPTCTSPPGPPSGPPLPSDMLNDVYVLDYTLVPSDDTRPLLCASGMTPTGNFSCKLFDRYFAVFETPYPTCQNSTCKAPPEVATLENFAAWDVNGSTDGVYCPNISASNSLPHGGICAVRCAPGFKVDNVYRCEQGQFLAPRCQRLECAEPSSLNGGRLLCRNNEERPFFGAVCDLRCRPGYVPSNLVATCATDLVEPEAQPAFTPPVQCAPGICGDYPFLISEDENAGMAYAVVEYATGSRDVDAMATLTCLDGYSPGGSAFGLSGNLELRCGPVVNKENEPEVEWKLEYTGARAGRICAPDGLAVYDTVVLLGNITMTLNLPSTLTRDQLCTTFKDRFVGDISLALVMGLSSAGQVALNAASVLNVEISACESSGGLRRRLAAIATAVSFAVKVENDAEALQLQSTVTEQDASDVFDRVFSLALLSSSGIDVADLAKTRMIRDILYIIDKPDGTQVSVVRDNSSNDTDNDTGNGTGGDDEDDFLGSPAFVGIVVGSSCCCCCVVCCWLRRRYVTDVYADWEESEEEGFDDDPVIDVIAEK